jgi:hypothetical protein
MKKNVGIRRGRAKEVTNGMDGWFLNGDNNARKYEMKRDKMKNRI